ncbi:MAG: hypothetical protein Q9218_002990 [Villophora microphyllina]
MAAPQIPNLNTFRRGAPRLSGRGHGGPSDPSSSSTPEDHSAKDRIVQQTDQDASISRLSAVELGYLDDPFAGLFVSGPGQRRFPIINRGTYVRTSAIDALVLRFLSPSTASPTFATHPNRGTRKQIISLGAGSDTRFFRLRLQQQHASPSLSPFIYHELDFPSNTHQKTTTITRSPALTSLIPGGYTVSGDGTSLSSGTYYIHALDLRDLADPSKVSTLELKGVDTSIPTLLISECCLIYLPPHQADAVVDYFTKHLFRLSSHPPSPSDLSSTSSPLQRTASLALILYEPLNPHDPFGKTMVRNLAQRGIVLQTLQKYGSKEAQVERLRDHGFSGGREVRTVDEMWEAEPDAEANVILNVGIGQAGGDRKTKRSEGFTLGIGEKERERVGTLEMVDEVEEWRLLAGHYCVAWGWRDGDVNTQDEDIWQGWKGLPRTAG